MADYLGLTLEVVDWRDVVPEAGRPRQVIFDQLKPTSWDIFIGILWHRFGTPPGGQEPKQKDYLSGTKKNFDQHIDYRKQFNKPRIVMYRCLAPIPQEQILHSANESRLLKAIQDPQRRFQTFTKHSIHRIVSETLLDNLQKSFNRIR